MAFADRNGPYAVVTGASSGIGEAFARALAARGMHLVLVARRTDRLQVLADELTGARGVEVVCAPVDLAAPDAADRVVAATDGLDVGLLISNAGTSVAGEHGAMDPADVTAMLMINAYTPLQLTRAFAPRLRARRRGGVILTGSIEGLIGTPYSATYSGTKALVQSLGESLWAELGPDGVDVLTVCPGATASELLVRSGSDPSRMPHVSTAEDVAEFALAHLSEGPTLVSSDHYRLMYDGLLAMPRREALASMAAGMKRAGRG